MPKNIVVFADGILQEGGKGHNTNVYKLLNMIEDRTENQISFYERGLGTDWRPIKGNVIGVSISKNIMECYEFITENYMPGDNIFLFGFNMGATTVRSLSALIHLFGILPKSRPELIKQAYNIYKESDATKRKNEAKDFLSRHHNQWCKIKFLGVWDTVAALGLPFNKIDFFVDWSPSFSHKYHNLRLSESVTHARQALAIDDERLTYHPIIWDKEVEDYQTMKQVWFSGMHSDVGGGYKEHGLSDIALIWMVLEAKQYGLLILPKNEVEIDENPDGIMHNSRKGFPKSLFRKKIRSWNSDTHGYPVVHESVLLRTLNNNNEESSSYAPWILSMDYNVEPWRQDEHLEKIKQEHLEKFKQGASEWNKWREEYKDTKPYLVNQNVKNLDLKNANLSKANMKGIKITDSDLTGVNLRAANLESAILKNVKLSDSILNDANMYKIEIIDSDLSKLEFRNVKLNKSKLAKINLSGATLSNVKLISSNLSGAILADATLTETYLTGANLTEVNLKGTNLRSVDLTDAELSGAHFDEKSEYKDIKGVQIGVNGLYCETTDSAALMTLTPPGNSMQGSNADAVIESIKRARSLHSFSMALAGFTGYIFLLGKTEFKPPFINEEISVSIFGLLAMLISIGVLNLVIAFLADGLKGARFINDRNSAMIVGNFPWIISKYARSGGFSKIQSWIIRFIMSFHTVVYLYYWEIWIYPKYVYFICAGILLILSARTFQLSKGFQKPILFDTKSEVRAPINLESVGKAIEMLREDLKPSQQEENNEKK